MAVRATSVQIGRLPYLYFLLLRNEVKRLEFRLEDCRIYTSFYSVLERVKLGTDWKTAVFILPFTDNSSMCYTNRLEDCRIYTSFYFARTRAEPVQIGRLPCLYFLLLLVSKGNVPDDWKTAVFILLLLQIVAYTLEIGLEDCRIYTSFYFHGVHPRGYGIGRLPYLYFLLLIHEPNLGVLDWKTAVFILPFTRAMSDNINT